MKSARCGWFLKYTDVNFGSAGSAVLNGTIQNQLWIRIATGIDDAAVKQNFLKMFFREPQAMPLKNIENLPGLYSPMGV